MFPWQLLSWGQRKTLPAELLLLQQGVFPISPISKQPVKQWKGQTTKNYTPRDPISPPNPLGEFCQQQVIPGGCWRDGRAVLGGCNCCATEHMVICSRGCSHYSISCSPQISHLFCSSLCTDRAPRGSLTLTGYCWHPKFLTPVSTSPRFRNPGRAHASLLPCLGSASWI